MRSEKKNILVIDAGDALFSSQILYPSREESSRLKARIIIKGYEKIGCDAFNIGSNDLASGFDFLKSLRDSTTIPLVSANLIDTGTREPVFKPTVLKNINGLKIAILGLIEAVPQTVTEVYAEDYITVGKDWIASLRPDNDLVIVLVNANRSEYDRIKSEFSEADYIFTSGYTGLTRVSELQLSGGPFLISPGKQGKNLAVVDLEITNLDSPLVDVSSSHNMIEAADRRLTALQKRDPDRTLEEIYADQPNVLKIIQDYREKKVTAEKVLAKAVNRSSYSTPNMGKSIPDDEILLVMVETTLDRCKQLDKQALQGAQKTKAPKSAVMP